MRLRVFVITAISALTPADARAQSLASRIEAAADGAVTFHFAARPGVCGDGEDFIRTGRSTYHGSFSSRRAMEPCVFGPVQVRLTVNDGAPTRVQFWVGPLRPREARDLGAVSAAEAARYLMIWVVFLAAGLTLEVGRHVSVDVGHALLSTRTVRILFVIIDIVGFVFSVAAAFYSLKLALFVAGTGQISPTLGVPTYILYVAPFVGFASLAFRFLLRLANVRDARRAPVPAEWLRSAQP